MKRIGITGLLVILVLTGCTVIEDLRYGSIRNIRIYNSAQMVSSPKAVRLRTGEMMVVFREGADASAGGKILKIQSRDGKHWSVPDTLVSTGRDCRNPSVVQLRDGLILVNFYQTNHGAVNAEGAIGCFTVRSFDNGKTFTSPRRVLISEYEWIATSDAMLELTDGTLLYPVYGAKPDGIAEALILISRNMGETWQEAAVAGSDPNGIVPYRNPAICQLKDGSILCVVQAGVDGNSLAQSVSTDGGRTWSPVRFSGCYGTAPDLLLTSEGSLLCAYREFWPEGVSYMRSYNRGESWEQEIQLNGSAHCVDGPGLVAFGKDIFAVYSEDFPVKSGGSEAKSVIQGIRFMFHQPEMPKGASVSVSGSRVTLRWNSVPGAVYYRVYRDQTEDFIPHADDSDSTNMIATPISSQYKEDVVRGQTYYYRISAVAGTGKILPDTGGESIPTQAIQVEMRADSTSM